MIDHVWSVICTHAVVDRHTNLASMHDVIEQVNIKGEPAPDSPLPIQIDLISFWIRSKPDEPATIKMRVSFVSPSGEESYGHEGSVDLSEHERIRNIFRIENLPIKEPGRHYLIVKQAIDEDDWKVVASLPLSVVFMALEEEEGGNEKA